MVLLFSQAAASKSNPQAEIIIDQSASETKPTFFCSDYAVPSKVSSGLAGHKADQMYLPKRHEL